MLNDLTIRLKFISDNKQMVSDLRQTQKETMALARETSRSSDDMRKSMVSSQRETQGLIQDLQNLAKSNATASGSLQSIAKNATAAGNNFKNLSNASQLFSKQLEKQSSSLKSFTQNIGQSLEKMVNRFGQLSFNLQNVASTLNQVTMPFQKLIGIGTEFEYKMSGIGAVSSATQEEMSILGSSMRKLASESVFSANEVGDAGSNLARAGFSVTETITALPGALNLAAASGESLAMTSEIATAQLRAFRLETSESTMVADLFSKAANMSNASVGYLGENMKYSAPIFASANQNIATLVTASSMLKNVGQESGTPLRMAMLRLAGPTEKAAGMMEELGGNVEDLATSKEAIDQLGLRVTDSNGKFRDFADILVDLNKATAKMRDDEKLATVKGIFGVESSTAIMELIDKSKEFTKTIIQNGKAVKVTTTEFKEFRREVGDNKGFAETTAKRMLDNLKGDMFALSGNIEEFALTIFDVVGPILRPIIQGLTEGVKMITHAFEMVPKTFKVFTDGLMTGLSPLTSSFSNLFHAISPVIDSLANALSPILAPISKLFGQLHSSIEGESAALTVFKGVVFATGSAIGQVISFAITPFVDALTTLTKTHSFYESGVALVSTFVDGIKAAGQKIWDAVLSVFDYVAALFPHSDAEAGPFSQLTQSGKALISTIADAVLSSGKVLYDNISSVFSPVLSYIIETFSGIRESVKSSIAGFSLNDLASMASSVFQTINGQIQSVVQTVSLFTQLASSSLSSLFDSISSKVSEAISWFNQLDTTTKTIIITIGAGLASVASVALFGPWIGALTSGIGLSQKLGIGFQAVRVEVVAITEKLIASWPQIVLMTKEFLAGATAGAAMLYNSLIELAGPTIIAPMLTAVSKLPPYFAMAKESVASLISSVASLYENFQRLTTGMSFSEKMAFIATSIKGYDWAGTFRTAFILGTDAIVQVFRSVNWPAIGMSIARGISEGLKVVGNFILNTISVFAPTEAAAIGNFFRTTIPNSFEVVIASAQKFRTFLTGMRESIRTWAQSVSSFFSNPFSALQASFDASIIAIGAALGIGFVKIKRILSNYFSAFAMAKECRNNPLMKCMLPPTDAELRSKLREGKRGIGLSEMGQQPCPGSAKCAAESQKAAQATSTVWSRSWTAVTALAQNLWNTFLLSAKAGMASLWASFKNIPAIQAAQGYMQRMWIVASSTSQMLWNSFKLQASSAITQTGVHLKAMWASAAVATQTAWTAFTQRARTAVAASTPILQRLWIASSAHASLFWSSFLQRASSSVAKARLLVASVWTTGPAALQTFFAGFSQRMAVATAAGSSMLKRMWIAGTAHSANLWTTFSTHAAARTATASSFIGRAFTASSAHIQSFWAKFAMQANTTIASTGQKLGGLLSSRKAGMGALAALGTFALTAGVSSEAKASDLGNTPMPQQQKPVLQTGVTESMKKDFQGMLNTFGVLKPAIDGITYAMQNMETVGMGALMVLSTGLVTLGGTFTAVSMGAAGLAGFFAGWQIGKLLYDQFAVVRETSISVVGTFVEMGQSIAGTYNTVMSLDFSQIGSSLLTAIGSISDGIPQVAESLNDLWHGLGDVFTAPAQLLSDLVSIVGTAVGEITGAIAQGNWIDVGASIIRGLVNGVVSVGSFLSTTVLGITKMAISALLPEEWYQAGSRLLSAFGQGIVSIGSSIYNSVMGVFNYIWNLFPHSDALEGPFSGLTQSGSALIMTFVNGIVSSGSALLTSISGIFSSVEAYILTIDWAGYAVALYEKFTQAFSPDVLLNSITNLIKTTQDYLGSINWTEQGTAIMGSLSNAVIAGSEVLINSFKTAFQNVINYISSVDFTASGQKILETVGSGVASGVSSLTTSVSDSLSAVRNFLPFSDAKEGPLSDLTASGQSIPKTIAAGVNQSSGELASSVKSMASSATSSMGTLTDASKATAISMKNAATEASQEVKSIQDQIQAASDRVFELTQKLSLTKKVREKKEIKKELVDARTELHDLKKQLKEEKDIASERKTLAKETEQTLVEAAKDTARMAKEALYDQADAVTKLADRYSDAGKQVEEYANKLKTQYEDLQKLQDEFAKSGLSQKDAVTYDSLRSDQGNYAGVIAQTKMLTSANQELVAAKNELAKATMSESQARLYELQQKYTDGIALEIFQTQELAKQKKAVADEDKKTLESQMTGGQKDYYEMMKNVGVEETKRIVLQRQMISEQEKLKQQGEQYWNSISEKAGDYFDKFAEGQISAKGALKGFFGDVLKEQKKMAMEGMKKQFLGLFGLDKTQNENTQVQKDLNKAAQFLAKSNEGVIDTGKSAAGTIAKAVEETGKKLSSSVNELGAKVSDAVDKAKMLMDKSASLKDQVSTLREQAQDTSVLKAGREMKAELRGNIPTVSAPTTSSSAVTSELKNIVTQLGTISAKYESAGRGIQTVSSGKGDPGGVSYGAHQLASKTGTMDRFLKSVEGQTYGALLKGLKIGSDEFNQKYKQIAQSDGVKFAEAQHTFITKTHYAPLEKYASKYMDTSNAAIKEMLYSASVQHGKAKSVVDKFVQQTGGVTKDVDSTIKAFYAARADYVKGVAMPPKTKAAILERYENESKDVLDYAHKLATGLQGAGKEMQSAVDSTKSVVSSAIRASETVRDVAPKRGQESDSSADLLREDTVKLMSDMTNQYIQKGVTYKLGAKNIELGAIDCSGFVNLLTKTSFEKINEETGKTVFDKSSFKLLNDSSHNIIQNIVDKTGFILDSKVDDMRSQLKEGMVIGLDKGKHGWDAGRARKGSQIDVDIDHIVQVTVDKVTGKLGVSESRSVKQGGKQTGGVTWTDLDKWMDKNKNVRMFATDPFKLASKEVQGAFASVSKASVEQASIIQQNNDAVKQQSEAIIKSSLENTNAMKQQADATIQSALVGTESTQSKMTSDAALQAVEAMRTQSVAQDAMMMGDHVQAAGAASGALVEGAKKSVEGVAQAAGQASAVIQENVAGCVASQMNSPALETIAEAQGVGQDIAGACGGSGTGGGLFDGLMSSIGSFFGGGKGGKSGGFLDGIISSVGSMFGGGKDGGKSGGFLDGIMSTVGSFFGGGKGGKDGGGLLGSLTSSLGGMLGGGKGGSSILSSIGGLLGGGGGGGKGLGDMIGGLAGQLGGLGGSMGEVGKSISGLLGGGSTPGMTALTAGMSLLKGDMAGAAAGAASLLASMTPLGPIGGMVAGKLVELSGIGAKWVRESEWAIMSVKGFTAEYSKGFKETKKGFMGGSRTGTEELDKGTIEELNKVLGKTKEVVLALSKTLNISNNSIMKSLSTEMFHIEDREGRGEKRMTELLDKMNVSFIRATINSLVIAGESISEAVIPSFQQNFNKVLTGTFNLASHDETWDGLLTRFVSTQGVATNMAEEASKNLADMMGKFVTENESKLKSMSLEEMTNTLQSKVSTIFSEGIGTSLGSNITRPLAEVFAEKINLVFSTLSGDLGSSDLLIKKDTTFFSTLKNMVNEFSGDSESLNKFINDMIGLKDTFHEAGLSTDLLSKGFVKNSENMQELKAASQLFTEKFVGDVNKSFNKFIAAVDPVKKVFTTLADAGKPLPKTRAEFTKLMTSLDKDSSDIADTLLKNVSSFDDYYAHLEASQEKINSFVTDLGQAPIKSIKELSDEFNTGFSELGMAAPKTKSELAKLASSLDLTTESGSQTFASIQKLSPKFKEMQDRLESMGIDTTSIDSLKEQVNSSFKELDMQVPIPNTIDGFKQLASSLDLSTASGLAMFSAIEQATPAMQKLGEEVGKVFSIDSSSLASSFSDAITNSTSAMEASQKVKDEFEGQMLKGMMDTTLNSISSTLYDAVVSPMLSASAQAANETINSSIYAANTNISAATTSAQLQTTGAVNASSTTVNSAMTSGQITTSSAVNAGAVIQTSGVLTGAALQQVVEHVTSQIKNMAVVMNELKKSGAMEEIKNALGDTAAVAYKEMAPLVVSARKEEPSVQTESLAQQEQQRQAEERQQQEERIQEERNQQEEKAADDARNAIEEAKKRAEEARKVFTDFGVGLDVLSLGIEGNAKVMYDLKRTYNDATMAQLMTTTSSKDLIEKMKGMSQAELEAMAKSAGVELSKLTSDLSGLVEMAKASEKSMTDFRTKMEVASGAMTDNEQTLKRLSEQYPNLTKMFGEQELSSKDLAKQFSTMSDDKLLELSSNYGVSIEKFTSESETYVNALKTQEESLKTQADTLKELSGNMDSFREKMKQSVTGASDNMLNLSKVDVGVSSMTTGMSSKEMASMFAGMDDAKFNELTSKFGVTFDKLKGDAELLVSTAKATEEGLADFRNSLGTMSGSMNENQLTIQKLSQKYPLFSDVLNNSSVTLSSAIEQFNSLSDDQLKDLASSLGIEFETLKSDASQWLGILKQDDDALKESTKNIQSFQTEMKKNAGVMTESAITLSDLSQRYPALSNAINDSSITAKDAASAFMNMDMSAVAKQSNVSVDQLITDAQSWLGVLSANDEALKENEETAKANNEALLDYRQTMLKATGTYSESQLSLKKMTDTYPLLSKVIDNTSVSSKDAAKYLGNLSSSGLDTLAKDFGMSTDQFRETSSEWIGILASNEESFNSFNKEMSKLGSGLSDNQIILNGLAEKYPQLSQIILNSGMTADQAAKSFSSMTSVDLTEMAAKFGVSMETLQTDIQSFVSALPNKEIFSGLRDGLDELINPLSGSEKTINDLAKKYPQLNLAANALDINVSQAVDSIKSMTDESMITWANENGIAYEEAKDSTIAYLSAVKELQQQLGSFKDEMHQLATGMSENEMTMERLKSTYPALASSLDKTGVSAQEVGKFFDQLSQQQIQDMATAQGVSVEAFISDVKSYITVLKDNNEKFSSFKNEISKFTNTLSENESIVKRLTEQYPSFISNMEKLGSSSKDVASNLSSMNEGRLTDIANQVGMTIEEFTKNSNDYLTALAAQEEEMKNSVKSVVGMQTEFRKMTSGLSDAQYTVNSLTSKYPNLIQSMGLTGKSADDVAKKFMNMDPEKLVGMAKGLGTSTDEFVGEISNYVSALKTLGDEAKAITDSLNSFKGEMDKMGSSLTDNEYTIANITKSFPALTSELSSLGSGSKEIAQSLAGMSTGQLSAMAKQTGVSVDEFIGNSKSYIEALKTREENLKQTQEQAVQDAKETQDKVMQTIDNYFSIFNQLSDKIANLSNNLVKDISAYDTEEQKIEKRRNRMTELENSINSLNSFGLDNEKAISKTIEDMDEYRGLIIEETNQKIDLVKKEQEAAQKAHDDTINALKESLSKVQGVISSVNSDIEKLNEELKQNQSKVVARDTLKTKFTSSLTDSSKTTNEKIDLASQYRESIGSALQEQLAALDKNRDEAISNLEKERDAKLKHFEEVQDAAKKLQESVSKLKESIASMRTSVQGDMEKLAKDMGLPGTTATEKLTALQSQIGSKMPVNEESIKKLETYKGLVMESLNEQIEKENKRFEEVKKTQDAQRDHYKKLIDFSKELKGFVDNLKLGDTSYYNPQRRLDEAKRQYEEVLALARTGDEQAMSEVTGKAQTYLKEAQSFYASSDDYTKIFDSVNANMEGMRTTAEGEAKKIAENLPLDETETAKNVANIVPLQQAAMDQLKSVDGLLASMDTTLQNPSASPMPDEQFSRMLESERQNFDKLIEAQKQTTIDDGNKLREAAKIELQNLNNSLQGIQTSLEASSSVKFDDTVFANQITGLQQTSVQQLMELGQYVIAMDAGIKDSLNQNVSALMSQLSPENQAKVAAQLDEAMQKNITGPLYELIAAVKGESVKKGNEKLEAGFKDNQTAINNAITAFSQYREMSNLTGIQLSFDDFINKISPLITNVANPSSMTGFTVNKDVAGINTLLSTLGVSQENLGRATQQVESIMSQILVEDKNQKWENTWSEFKTGYLQGNKELMAAFQSTQTDKKAVDLAKYREMSLIVSGIESSFSMIKGAAINQGRTSDEVYNSLDKTAMIGMAQQKGLDIPLETYQDFKNAKASLDEIRKSLLGIVELKPGIESMAKPVIGTVASQGLTTMPTVGSTSTTVKPIQEFMKATTSPATASSAITGSLFTGNVSSSGAKDIIVKIDEVFNWWKTDNDNSFKLQLEQRKFDQDEAKKLNEDSAKSTIERYTVVDDMWKLWREEELLWRNEDVARNTINDALSQAWHGELIAAINGINTQVISPAATPPVQQNGLPSFDVGSQEIPKDMVANVHKGEIIIDPKSSNVLRNYGIKIDISKSDSSQGNADMSKVEKLLEALLQVSVENGQRISKVEDSVYTLEDSVGKPIKRAVEKGNNIIKRS